MKCLISILAMLISFSGLVSAQAEPEDFSKLTDADKVYALGLIWSEAKYNFAFFDQVPDLDWDAAYRQFLPLVLAAKDDLEFYRTLMRFAALLKDGHTAVGMPEYLRKKFDRPAITVGEVEGKPVVIAIDKNLSNAIPLGSVITSIDGVDALKFAEERVMPYLPASTNHARLDNAFRGSPLFCVGILWRLKGSKIAIAYETPAGKAGEAELVCDHSEREVKWEQLRQPEGLIEWRRLDGDIAYVALNSFNNPKIVDDFKALVPELRTAKGVVIDIRNNGGGSTTVGTDILDHFTTKGLQGGKWKTREHRSAFYAWAKNNPENAHYKTYGSLNAWFEGGAMTMKSTDCEKLTVPVVVLIDYQTFSAAEDFLVFCDQLEQFTLVGRPTAGSTGQPILTRLPQGGWAAVCAKRDTYPDGREFVGYGVQPDVYVGPTIKSIAEGRDAVLEKGVEILKSKIAQKQ